MATAGFKGKRMPEVFLISAIFAVVVIGAVLSMILTSPAALGSTNESVRTKVNVTNTEPNIYLVQITPSTINLNPGSTVEVVCNASVYDSNGWDDITNVSATLFDTRFQNNWSESATDNNYRYTNLSCESCTQISSTNASCTCTFDVLYYANNGTWICNMTVGDQSGINDTENSSYATINTALGIDVPSIIDFDNLSVLETSSDVRHNVTNFGNIPMNVSVLGYGGDNSTTGSNLSMVCSSPGSLANISNIYQRYSLLEGTNFDSMYNTTNESTQIPGLTVPFRTTDDSYGNSTNATFWKLRIPLGVSGECNGTLVFTASES